MVLISRTLLLSAVAGVALPAGAPIAVAVSGIESARGQVHVDICPAARFAKEDCPWAANAPAVAGTTTVRVPGVPPGRYAAQATHDANGNGKVDFNILGIPTERIGFSNDARARFGPPRFAAAAFDHGAVAQRIAITVRRLP